MLVGLAKSFPNLLYLEDPIRSESAEGWVKLMTEMKEVSAGMKYGSRCLYSSPEEIEKVIFS